VLGAAGEGEGEAEEAAAARQHLLLPTESDELAVDAEEDGEVWTQEEDGEGRLVVRASLCCEDRAGLILDIARGLAVLRLRTRRDRRDLF
jgi:hypothetical protein